MKQAKDEAEKEMEEYRSRLEEEYQTQNSGVISTKTKARYWDWFVLILYILFQTEQEAAAKRLEEETDGRIQNLKESSSKVSKEIVKMLIKYVTTTGAWCSLYTLTPKKVAQIKNNVARSILLLTMSNKVFLSNRLIIFF